MKKIATLAVVAFMALQGPAFAQRPHPDGPAPGNGKHPEITELVSDLSSSQKSKLETISNDSRKRVDHLRGQQKAVRDSINRYIEMESDQSKKLYPLFDREARLQVEISREMYATKVRIDQVLTPAQRKELNACCKKQNARGKHPMRRRKK